MSWTGIFFKGDGMDDSLVIGINRVAEIYGRAPLTPEAAALYKKATGILDDKEFFQKLFMLLKSKSTFPLPADFNDATAS